MMLRLLLPLHILIGCCTPVAALAAANLHIQIEWGFSPPEQPETIGYNLYQEGVLVCQTDDAAALSMECTVALEENSTQFTLTAEFSDGTESPHSSPYPFALENTVQQLYVICLGRAADQGGLDYWTDTLLSGALTVEQLRNYLFHVQLEADGVDSGSNARAQLVAIIYLNLFNREPDPDGLAYWVYGGGASVAADQLIVAFLDAASDSDWRTFENKMKVAAYYTAKLGDPDRFDLERAVETLAEVNESQASVSEAKAAIDAAHSF